MKMISIRELNGEIGFINVDHITTLKSRLYGKEGEFYEIVVNFLGNNEQIFKVDKDHKEAFYGKLINLSDYYL